MSNNNKFTIKKYLNDSIRLEYVPDTYYTIEYNGLQVGGFLQTKADAQFIVDFLYTLDPDDYHYQQSLKKQTNIKYNKHK